MSRDSESGAPFVKALPVLPLVLSGSAIVAALLAAQTAMPGAWAALALVLTAGACAGAGALWQRQRLTDRLGEARRQQHLWLQLVDSWTWKTDAEHRLVRLQPPLDSPASSWANGAFGGQLLWERFADAEGALAPRMHAQAALPETTVRCAAGTDERPWRLRGLPCLDGQGRFAGYVGTARPEAPAAAAATAVADEEARGRAAEHAAFSYTISHDLRAPLRVVEGFGRILKEDYGAALDRIGNDHLDRMIGAAARMNHMIDALLALSELSVKPIVRQPVNLSQLAQYVVDDLRRGAPERQVDVRIEPGLAAQGDPTLLRVVLDNLLGNAWKYTGKRADAEIAFERAESRGQSAFVVRDNGAGFDMRFVERLFGAFQRLHSQSEFQGTGVGLASVRRIVERHGGEIWAEAEVGRGARFYFTLPG